jgi:hypothetical protein
MVAVAFAARVRFEVRPGIGSVPGAIFSLGISGFGIVGFSSIGGFGGSVPVVVLVLAEQLQGLGGLGENTDGFGAPYLDGVGVASLGEDLSDPVDSGFEPDGIAGGRPGNDQLQAVFGLAAQPHKRLLGSGGGLLFGAVRVSLNYGCLQQGLDPPPGQRTK